MGSWTAGMLGEASWVCTWMVNAAAMTPGNPTEAWAREELPRQ